MPASDSSDTPPSDRRTRPFLAHLIESGIRRALGDIPGGLDAFESPSGDPGLFGPDSMAWKVHCDLPAMLIGGFCALMIQMLHPLAMAGVAAHSRFRQDPLGRLQRTGRFVAGTTYGAMPYVEQLISEVRAVHERVHGVAPDGRRYAASDPELLCFVHVSEVWSFLAGYQRYSLSPLLKKEKDQYFEEMAEVAHRLGANDVPTSLSAIRSYLRDVEPQLCRSAQTDEAMQFLKRPVAKGFVEAASHKLILAAATDLMPERLQRMLGLELTLPGTNTAVRSAAAAFAISTRWALGPSPVVSLAFARATAQAS